MNKYLKDLETELKKNNLSDEEISEILADHREMIETAKNEGLSDEELNEKFGYPKDVALELSDFSEKQENINKEEKNQNYSFENVNENYKVDISIINEDLKLESNTGSNIDVDIIGKIDPKKLEVKFEDNTLCIKTIHKKSFFNYNSKIKTLIIVKLPKDIKANEILIKTINGDTKINDVLTNDLKVGTNNGDLEISALNINEFNISTINGDPDLDNIKCKNFNLSTISGDVELKNSVIEEDFLINTVSGDLDFNNVVVNELSLKTVSGDLNGKELYPNELSISSVSGDVNIVNSNSNKPIKLKKKRTVSGDIDIYIK